MELRRGTMEDLPPLKAMYRGAVAHMAAQGIDIWDDVYPSEFIKDDIEGGALYLLEEAGRIVAAFALCGANGGEDQVRWRHTGGKAVYIDRLVVDAACLRQGMGALALCKAKEAARGLGARHLRLFVVDGNEPALRLYRKQGFTQAEGVYEEKIDDDLVLREYGFEMDLP